MNDVLPPWKPVPRWAWQEFGNKCWDEYQESWCEKHGSIFPLVVSDCPYCQNG